MFRRKPRTIKKNNNTLHDKIREGKSTWHKSITDKVGQETKTKSAYNNSAYFKGYNTFLSRRHTRI